MVKCQAKNTPMEINAIPASLSLPQHSKFFLFNELREILVLDPRKIFTDHHINN
jgi:hypothetical protein